MSRPKVNESLKYNFIKVILTKDQIKSGCVESSRTHYCIGKLNTALSLCRALEVALYFSKSFSEAVAEALWLLEVTIICFLGQESNLWSPVLQ